MNINKAIVLTWGCTHNQKDSQILEYILKEEGYELLPENQLKDASLVIFNTCTVKTPTENKILSLIDKTVKTNKKIIISGCLSQSEPEKIKKRYPNAIVLGVDAYKYLPNIIRQNNINLKIENDINKISKPLLKSTKWNKYRNIIQINEGCLNSCSFCATKNARGRLQSSSLSSIIEAIRKEKTPEVWLTSQDTACWGFDIQSDLSKLIYEIDKINRKFWVRIGMGNPNNFIKILDDIVEAFQSDKIYKFLHLPVQSGSNSVLKHMKRGYTVEEYEEIVKAFRRKIPNITLSTDVICGYPTETSEDFKQTIETIIKTRPSITNISRYWERNNTTAAGLKQLTHEERKKRSAKLATIVKDMQFKDNKQWIGWEGEALLIDKGTKGGIQARNIYYKPIIINNAEKFEGQFVNIKIIDSTSTYFYGKII